MIILAGYPVIRRAYQPFAGSHDSAKLSVRDLPRERKCNA